MGLASRRTHTFHIRIISIVLVGSKDAISFCECLWGVNTTILTLSRKSFCGSLKTCQLRLSHILIENCRSSQFVRSFYLERLSKRLLIIQISLLYLFLSSLSLVYVSFGRWTLTFSLFILKIGLFCCTLLTSSHKSRTPRIFASWLERHVAVARFSTRQRRFYTLLKAKIWIFKALSSGLLTRFYL